MSRTTRRNISYALIIISVIIGILFKGEVTNTPAQNTIEESFVVRVVDGDTLVVRLNNKDQTLRLIGINTPETVDPRKTVECFGKEASNKAKELLTGKIVRVESDPTQGTYDKYDRMLAYVFVGDLFFNKYMIEEGYAYEYTYDIPYKYQDEFKAAQKQAQELKRGLWGENTCGHSTTTPNQ